MSPLETTIIVGAGHGGSQCAISLRSEGYEGQIVLVDDDVASLPYHKPPLSKKYLLSEDQEAMPLRPASAYDKASVERIQDTVLNIDTATKTITLSKTGEMPYASLVLATGASNRVIPALTNLDNVHSIRSLQDTKRLRDLALRSNSVTILGGGFIGLEVAACFAGMGKTVRVLEASKRVLSRVVAPEISELVQHKLHELGITLELGAMAVEFTKSSNRLDSIHMDDGSSIDIELLIVGIGAMPNDSLAKSAGIHCDDGIVVDHSLKTSVTDVFSLGDCCRFPHWQTHTSVRLESVQNAVDQSKQVAQQIATGVASAYKTVPWFWSDIGPLKLQIAGIYTGETQTVKRREDDKFALYHLQNQQVVCVETINNAKEHMLARKLIALGVSVTAEDIVEGPGRLKSLLDA
ncbi:MAG: NAD(P)/FAD-dependent oxidoreductase [Granulosicoccus sp.]